MSPESKDVSGDISLRKTPDGLPESPRRYMNRVDRIIRHIDLDETSDPLTWCSDMCFSQNYRGGEGCWCVSDSLNIWAWPIVSVTVNDYNGHHYRLELSRDERKRLRKSFNGWKKRQKAKRDIALAAMHK